MEQGLKHTGNVARIIGDSVVACGTARIAPATTVDAATILAMSESTGHWANHCRCLPLTISFRSTCSPQLVFRPLYFLCTVDTGFAPDTILANTVCSRSSSVSSTGQPSVGSSLFVLRCRSRYPLRLVPEKRKAKQEKPAVRK
jgi:hypothetical protein